MTRAASLFVLLLLAACARSEDAVLAPLENNQEATKVEAVQAEPDDQEVALGGWRDTLQDDQRALEFGPTGAPPVFSLRCDARRVLLQRHGLASAGELPVMHVGVGGETRQLAVTATGGANPMLRAALAGSDPLLASLGRATTAFTVRVGDTTLNLPPSPLIAAYVGQCASGEAPRPLAAESNSAGNTAADAGD
jgi:hypothetical protein